MSRSEQWLTAAQASSLTAYALGTVGAFAIHWGAGLLALAFVLRELAMTFSQIAGDVAKWEKTLAEHETSIAQVTADAFSTDPVDDFYIPDDQRRV